MPLHRSHLSALEGHDLDEETGTLLRALRSAPAPFAVGASPAPGHPERLIELARLNKALPFLDPAGLPPPQRAFLEEARLRTAAINLGVLALAREVADALAAAGIPALHLKGPLQQADLLGSPLVRPVADVDLLVRARDRRAARAVLEGLGFQSGAGRLAPWWSLFLGELHLRRPGGGVVDLHHRLDQPGVPRVRAIDDLFAAARTQPWRGFGFPVPSSQDQALIALLGIVKALLGGEPCGGHLVDARAALDRMDERGRSALRARAARLGLRGLLDLGAQALDAAFAEEAGRRWGGSGPGPLRGVTDAVLRRLLIAPWTLGPARPRRRALVWAMSGGSPTALARALAWMQMSHSFRDGLALLFAISPERR